MLIILVLIIIQCLIDKNISQIYNIIQREGINDFLERIIEKKELDKIEINKSGLESKLNANKLII